MTVGNFIYIKEYDNMELENFNEWEEGKRSYIKDFDTLEESLKKRIYQLEISTRNTYDEVELEDVKEEELIFIWAGSLEYIEDKEQREIAQHLEETDHHWTGIIDFLNDELYDCGYTILLGN